MSGRDVSRGKPFRTRGLLASGIGGVVAVALGLAGPAPASPEAPPFTPESSPRAMPPPDSVDASSFPDLERWVQRYVEEGGRTVGMVAAVLGPEGTEMAAAGRARGDLRPTPETLFELGSVTKVFTSLLLAELAAEGLVELDTPIGSLVREGTELTPQVAEITLLELSTHTSGLPRIPGGRALIPFIVRPGDPYRGSTKDDLYRVIERLGEDDVRTRGTWRYSNLGPALLAHLLEEAAGAPWEELLQDRVVEPLGLEGTSVGAPPGTDRAMAQGHRENLRSTRPWRMDAYAPSGGMVSNLSDMVRFLEAVMEAEEGPLAETTRAAGSRTAGLGWVLQEEGGRRTIWHDGRTGGFYAFVGFDPEAGRGVVVLSNTSHDGNDFSLGLLHQEPEVAPIRVGWLPLTVTAALLIFSPLIVLDTAAREDERAEAEVKPKGRIHLLDGALTGLLFLAFAWKVGAWQVVSFGVWWLAVLLTLASLAWSLREWRGRPWWVSGARGRNLRAGLSLALVSALFAWALWLF